MNVEKKKRMGKATRQKISKKDAHVERKRNVKGKDSMADKVIHFLKLIDIVFFSSK